MANLTRNLIAFASAARTATTNSADLKNNNFKGCHAIIDMSAVTTGGTVTLDSGAPTASTGTITCASAVANTFATGTVTCLSAVANTFSTGTVTCATALAAVKASGTVTCATAIEGNTVTVNGLVYTGVSGTKADNTEFSIDTGDDETALDLAASINDDERGGTLDDLTATASTDTVTIVQTVSGTAGNATTLISSGATLTVSGANLSGGVDADTVTINGLLYTGVAGTKSDNTEFSIDTGNNETAADLSDSINHDVRTGTLGDISSGVSSAIVTVTTDVEGTAGDAITLVSSDGATLAVSAATLASGVDADTVTINGLTYTGVAGARSDNTEFSIDTSDAATGIDLHAAIDADTRTGTLGDISAADNAGGVVTITTDVSGTAGNAITLVSSDGVTLAVSAATLTSGVDADTVTVNGLLYTGVAGARSDDTEFSIDTGDNATATDLAAAITADVRVGTLNDVTATASSAIVTCTSSVAGTVGDATTLVSSDGVTLAVSGATFGSGVDASVDSITVNGVEIMSGSVAFITSLEVTATAVALNITNNASAPNYTATASGDVVTITSIIGGDTYVVVSTTTTIGTTDVDMDDEGSVVFKIQGKDELSGEYYDLIESAGVAIISTVVLKVYPGLTASANLIVSDCLPMDFRVVATNTGTVSMTYSVGINLLR